MRAHAQLAVAADSDRSTRIARLRSDPPLILRPTLNPDQAAPGMYLPGAVAVSLAAAAAGPVGGDQLRLDIEVGAGAKLVLRTVAATLVLPGPHGQPSHSDTTIRVGRGATMTWLPEPIIAAQRCHHHSVTRIHLEPEARLISREELILGRHGEQPGRVCQRRRVTLGQHALHDQELRIGPDMPGWHSPAVTGGRKALGNLLIVDPSREAAQSVQSGSTPNRDGDTAIMPLGEAATLVTALAHDSLTLRRNLNRHLTDISRTDEVPAAAPR